MAGKSGENSGIQLSMLFGAGSERLWDESSISEAGWMSAVDRLEIHTRQGGVLVIDLGHLADAWFFGYVLSYQENGIEHVEHCPLCSTAVAQGPYQSRDFAIGKALLAVLALPVFKTGDAILAKEMQQIKNWVASVLEQAADAGDPGRMLEAFYGQQEED